MRHDGHLWSQGNGDIGTHVDIEVNQHVIFATTKFGMIGNWLSIRLTLARLWKLSHSPCHSAIIYELVLLHWTGPILMYDMLHQLNKLPTAAILSSANILDSYQALIAEEGAPPLIMIATMELPHLVLAFGSHIVLTVAMEDNLPHFLSVLRL